MINYELKMDWDCVANSRSSTINIYLKDFFQSYSLVSFGRHIKYVSPTTGLKIAAHFFRR